uniref:Uncharacterized protein n=1 Tax=Nelumbo nucifera TaxID=4432 RepID=A0A822YU49_NELNU|nr:TPA_asm: hypothetical protein HUJ06_011619 [Nelumbo nucifera]
MVVSLNFDKLHRGVAYMELFHEVGPIDVGVLVPISLEPQYHLSFKIDGGDEESLAHRCLMEFKTPLCFEDPNHQILNGKTWKVKLHFCFYH